MPCRKLQELMTRIKTQQENLDDDSYSVLSSSTDLFFFYRESLKRCSKISTRRPLLDLATLFGKYLLNYKEILASKIPPYAFFSFFLSLSLFLSFFLFLFFFFS